MTRNFSNQRRENTGPSSRNTSSGRYREEQASRSARPRLSRDAVDRGWENGASRNHADYRPRQGASTPPSQRPGRPSPAFERSRQPYNHHSSETRPRSYGAPSSSSDRGGYQQRREQSPGPGPRRFNESGQHAPGGRPGPNSEHWTREPGPRSEGSTNRYQDRDRYQDTNRYQDEYQARGPARFNQSGPGAPERPNYRGANGSRSFERPGRDGENFARGQRTNDPSRGRRDNYNPRWQSRPTAQRAYSEPQRQYPDTPREHPPFRQGQTNERPGKEQFEGDYEHFETERQVERPEPYEKHVTRLPDGRVLKGSRPQQRKQARFWTEVEEESTGLIPPAPTHEPETEPITQEKPTRPARPRKQPESKERKVKTVKTTRARAGAPKADKAKTGKKRSGPQGPVIRPSQRGYKWPTTGE